MRVLFICKKNQNYGFRSYTHKSSGLYNSTRFIVEALEKRGVVAGIVEVNDNNDIDRVVSEFEPDIVVIEALWVVPEKFYILQKLHPGVNWFVHLHSHIPFLSIEGIAIKWLRRYSDIGVGIIANSPEAFDALRVILQSSEIIYLPNVYLAKFQKAVVSSRNYPYVDVGCFGAIRPLKNQLIQALAAIEFARQMGKSLRFHINASRVETMGDPVLKNIRTLFNGDSCAELIEHPWMEPDEFLSLLRFIDIGMQVSLTETFNVVTADYLAAGVPIVVSNQIKWASFRSKASSDSVISIVKVMKRAYGSCFLTWWNQRLLRKYSEDAQERWLEFCWDNV